MKGDVNMEKITAIEVQKRFKNRYNVYVNDTFAFGISEETLLHFNLHKGMDLPDELKKHIIHDTAFQKVYTKGLHYLSYALRSEHEVRRKLLDTDEALNDLEELVERAIEKLKEDNYIDDTYYAHAFIQNALTLTPKGTVAIKQALLKKGIEPEIIQNALTEIPVDTEIRVAIETAEKYINRQRYLSKKALVQKTKQFLHQKGFTFHIIDNALGQIELPDDEEQEWESLLIQGEKIWQRYRLKYEGYIFKQKLTQALYQKGFDSDLIKQFICFKEEE